MRQLQAAARQPPRQPSSNEDRENAKEIAEARRESSNIAVTIARAQEMAQASQNNARELDAVNARFQRKLQSSREALELQRNEACTQEQLATADACKELRVSASRLEEDISQGASTVEALKRQAEDLARAVEMIQSERNAVMEIVKEQDTDRNMLWSRLANLAAVRGTMPQQDDATISDLIHIIGIEWADARRRSDWAQRHGLVVQHRRRELEGELDLARETASRAALKLEDASADFEDKDRARRTQDRRATEDLASAEGEHALLMENRLEWKRTRPQLEMLIEELRVGSVQSKGAAESLGSRLVGLRNAIEKQSTTAAAAPTPASPLSSPPLRLRGLANSPEGQGAAGDAESNGDTPVPNVAAAPLFNSTESSFDGPGASTRMSGESLEAPVLPPGARDSEDPLVRKAAEDTDLLHKRVLALEGEKASLIKGQEELIRYIKDKVEPVQRALSSDWSAIDRAPSLIA